MVYYFLQVIIQIEYVIWWVCKVKYINDFYRRIGKWFKRGLEYYQCLKEGKEYLVSD